MEPTISRLRRLCTSAVLGLALLGPATVSAGDGASYASLQNAIASGNRDSILAEVERAEKLPCAGCVDLIVPLIDHQDPAVRDVAAWWLAKRPLRREIRDQMYERLTRGDTKSARNAAEVLGRFGHAEALMPLEIAMHDDALGDEARAAAAKAVGTIGAYAGKAILEGAVTSESPAVRAAAAEALRGIRGNTDAVALVPLLGDANDEVVHQAALTIGVMRESAGVGTLLDLMSDLQRPAVVRKHAAWALGKIGDGAAREVLRACSEDDPDMLVRGAARVALRDLR